MRVFLSTTSNYKGGFGVITPLQDRQGSQRVSKLILTTKLFINHSLAIAPLCCRTVSSANDAMKYFLGRDSRNPKASDLFFLCKWKQRTSYNLEAFVAKISHEAALRQYVIYVILKHRTYPVHVTQDTEHTKWLRRTELGAAATGRVIIISECSRYFKIR